MYTYNTYWRYIYINIMPSPAYYSKGLADTVKES